MKSETTKEKILHTAEEIMVENSFHSVGLKQILDSAKVPKGSFYHYFTSKEQFGVELLRHYMKDASDGKREKLDVSGSRQEPLNRLFDYLDEGVAHIGTIPGKFPCLAVKLASEVSDLSSAMRNQLEKGFEEWIEIKKELLDEAVARQQLPKTVDTRSEAEFIQDLWTGAIQRTVINRSIEPVQNAVRHIKSRLKALRG